MPGRLRVVDIRRPPLWHMHSEAPPMTQHDPVWVRQNGRSRWECPACPWSTPWATYTDPRAGAEAVRHALSMRTLTAPIEGGRAM